MSGTESGGDGSTQGSADTDTGFYSEAGSGDEESSLRERLDRAGRKAKGEAPPTKVTKTPSKSKKVPPKVQ